MSRFRPDLASSENPSMPQEHKYARIERERRFLLDRLPAGPVAVRIRHITDLYVDGTTLRLRQQKDERGSNVFKLTQKIAARGSGAQVGFITTMYITEADFRVLSQLPSTQLNKIRYSVPPFGIDVFQGDLEGLLIAEAEFDSAADAESLMLPAYLLHEVSNDERFTGGQLVRASRQDLQTWLQEYGIALNTSRVEVS
jgi:CYTH domain-containing protein